MTEEVIARYIGDQQETERDEDADFKVPLKYSLAKTLMQVNLATPKGQKLIIWDLELAREENFLAIPWQITLIGERYVEVETGAGKLRVKEVEASSGERMPNRIVRSIRQRFA